MANLLKIKGAQIQDGVIGDGHIVSGGLTAVNNLANKIFINYTELNSIAGSTLVTLDSSTTAVAAANFGTSGLTLQTNSNGTAVPNTVANGYVGYVTGTKILLRDNPSGEPLPASLCGVTGADAEQDLYMKASDIVTGDVTFTLYYKSIATGETAVQGKANLRNRILSLLFPEAMKFSDLSSTAFSTGVGFAEGLEAGHSHTEFSTFLTSSDISDFITMDDVTGLGYLTSGDISGLASTSALANHSDESTDQITGDPGAALVGISTVGGTIFKALSGDHTVQNALAHLVSRDRIPVMCDITAMRVGESQEFTVCGWDDKPFIVGSTRVYINGVLQMIGVQYTETGSYKTITLDSGCVIDEDNDKLMVVFDVTEEATGNLPSNGVKTPA